MFTGIVEATGEVVAAERTRDGQRLAVAVEGFDDLRHGQSISVSGVCLTVEAHGAEAELAGATERPGTASPASSGSEQGTENGRVGPPPGATADDGGPGRHAFEVFLAAETAERTYLGDLEAGDRVNLERALPADGRFDGHLVQGHVDAVTEVTGIERVGEDWRFSFAVPEGYGRYVVGKGSVALDGISLTVAARREREIDVAIVPTTYELTTLSEKTVGDPVHLEVDVVAKYVESMTDGYV